MTTTPTDWRALCAELADALEAWLEDEFIRASDADRQLVARARAALAQPEPEGPKAPTDNEIIGCMYKGHANISKLEPTWIYRHGKELIAGVRCVLDMVNRAALAQPEPQGPTDEELRLMAIEWGHRTPVEFARAVLARWGRPAIEPVPVAERLPGREDCDAEGRCWLTSVDVEPGWVTDNPEQCTNWTHWLPHHALPVPQP